ncbi:hypothetical protein HPB47_004113, partial [Ixodes persulcatus]
RSFSDLARHLNIGDPELGSSAMISEQEHGPLSVSTVNITSPHFWTSDTELWIIQVESQFAARRITADLTKYHHVVRSLPPATACEIRNLLFAPPAEDAFQQLLRETELGDRTPCQLLRKMQQLLGTRTTDLDSIMLQELSLQLMTVPSCSVSSVQAEPATSEKLQDIRDEISRLAVTVAALQEVCFPPV